MKKRLEDDNEASVFTFFVSCSFVCWHLGWFFGSVVRVKGIWRVYVVYILCKCKSDIARNIL